MNFVNYYMYIMFPQFTKELRYIYMYIQNICKYDNTALAADLPNFPIINILPINYGGGMLLFKKSYFSSLFLVKINFTL
jgi:hypothetical protein